MSTTNKITFTCWVHYGEIHTKLTFNNVADYDDLIPTIKQSTQLLVPQQPIKLYDSDPTENKNIQPLSPRATLPTPHPQDIYEIIERNHTITLLKGNPGIGKSFFVFYLLYLFRSSFKDQNNEHHVVYDRVNQKTLFFTDENGEPVACYAKSRKMVKHLFRIVSSPKKENYEQYMKEGGSNRGAYVMPLWDEQELENMGPIPRYVLEKVSEGHQEELILAISGTNLESCVSSINQPNSPQTGSHKVIHIDVLPNSGYIKQTVKFGSRYIKEKIIQRFYWNWRENIIQRASGSSNLSQVIGGIAYEQLAHQTLQFGGRFEIKSLEPSRINDLGNEIVINKSGVVSFLDMNSLKNKKDSNNFIEDDMYARPQDINFATIDSFLGNFLFQMTVSQRHPVSLKEFKDLLYNLNTENNNNSRQYYLFFVIPPEIFENFQVQDYIEVKKNQSKSSSKSKAEPKDLPTNVHQFALKMLFSSVEAEKLYPVNNPEDLIINQKPVVESTLESSITPTFQ
eukprot:gene4341-5433_t